MHLLGRYGSFAGYWLPKLSKEQAADGTVKMLNDGNIDGDQQWDSSRVGATAAFAIMILLQKHDFFPKREKAPAAAKKPGGSSPFGSKKPPPPPDPKK
jgi:hypothetical protein